MITNVPILFSLVPRIILSGFFKGSVVSFLRTNELPELFIFLLPGLIIVLLYRITLVGNKWNYSHLVLYCLFISSLYVLIVAPLFDYKRGVQIPLYLHSLLRLVLLPALVGLIAVFAKRKKIFDKFFNALRFTHELDSAWDYTFYQTIGEGRYCIVTISDGTKIHGWLGGSSFIGSGNENHDILLENMYNVNAEGSWVELDEPRSIYISKSDIVTIELFYDLDEGASNDT